MAENRCGNPHPLQGMKVIRTIPHDGGLMRERVCLKCKTRIYSQESDEVLIKEAAEIRLKSYNDLKADHRWAMQAIIDLVDAAQKIDNARAHLLDVAKGNR